MDATAATAQDKAKEWWARTKTAVGLQEEVEEEPANASLLDQFSEATTLNKTQVLFRVMRSHSAVCSMLSPAAWCSDADGVTRRTHRGYTASSSAWDAPCSLVRHRLVAHGK